MTRQTQTKLQAYSSAFYAECLANSEETVSEGAKVNVWKGFIGQTCRKLSIPQGMDRKVVKPLEVMGCITITQRGVGGYPTVLILHYPPTEELWVESDAPSALTRRPTFARLLSDVEQIKKSLGGGNVVAALADLDARVKALERKSQKGS